MSGDTFSAYYGEFLISPIPMELSFNYCSHGCEYCFANLNKPNRKANIQSTVNMLQQCGDRTSIEAYFLREKYPVLVSNRVDPFAVSNYRQSLPVLEMMTDLEIPLAFQTKGGRGIDEALSFLPRSCWYISIASLDEDYRKSVEPGAPSIADRLALIEKLVEKGHSVNVGVNPAVPEWLPNPAELMQALKSRGVHGVWIEPLHFSPRQVKRMKPRGKAAVGEQVIARALKRKTPPEYIAYLATVEDAAKAAGLHTFSVGSPCPNGFWDKYYEIYPKLLPTMLGFIGYLKEQGLSAGSVIGVDTFLDYMLPHLPKGTMRIGSYVGATAFQVCRDDPEWDNNMTFEALLRLIWSDGRIRNGPVRNSAFAWAGDLDTNGKLVTRRDSFGYPMLLWDTKGFPNYHAEVPRQAIA